MLDVCRYSSPLVSVWALAHTIQTESHNGGFTVYLGVVFSWVGVTPTAGIGGPGEVD